MTIDDLPDSAYDLSPKVAAHVLWTFGHGGFPPGDFTRRVLGAMAIADDDNLDRLSLAFPALTAAYRSAAQTHSGIARLQAIARAGGCDQ